MKNNWKKCKLADVIILLGGGTPKTSIKSYWNGQIPWISIKDFKNNCRFIYETEKMITEDGLNNSSTQLLQRNDIIISARGTVGELAVISKPMAFNQSCYGIRANENIESNFLFYLVKYHVNKLKVLTHGSVFDTITRDTFNSIDISVPPLTTQRQIAKILSSLDDKIELNNRINKNLEEQAMAIYKSWFVDFEPFGGKMPKDWKKTDIYSIAKIIYGAPFASKLFNTENKGIPIIRIRDLKNQEFVTYTTEKHLNGYLIQRGDIIVGMDGEFRPYLWGNDRAWLNQRVCVFENIRPYGKAFLFFSIKPLLDRIEKTQVATTVIHIGKKDFDAFKIILPNEKILDKYDKITSSMINSIVANKIENKKLTQLRGTLLPKLMNGEIDVSKIKV